MKPEDIQAIFGMQPEAAIEYLKQKHIDVSWDWQDMLDDAHVSAFTVAKTAGMDVAKPDRHFKISNANWPPFCRQKAGGDGKKPPTQTPAKSKTCSSAAPTV